MSRTINLRNKIIRALLTTDEVCGALIAKQIGCASESACHVLRELSPYLTKRTAPSEPGKNRIYYSAANRDALILIRDKKRVGTNGYTSGSLAPKNISFDALLNAWGIGGPRGCALPSHVHRIGMEDDQLFEEAA